MMDHRIYEALKGFVGSQSSTHIFPVQVTAVAGAECDGVDLEGVEQYDIRLRAAIDGQDNGVLVKPKVGSWILVGNIGKSDSELTVIATSEIESVSAKIDGLEFEVSAQGMELKRGAESLKGLLSELLDAISTITVTAAGSPSSTPLNAPLFTALKTRLNSLLR